MTKYTKIIIAIVLILIAIPAWIQMRAQTTLGGPGVTPGQKVMAQSLPVVIASNQTAVPVTISSFGSTLAIAGTTAATTPAIGALTVGQTGVSNTANTLMVSNFNYVYSATTGLWNRAPDIISANNTAGTATANGAGLQGVVSMNYDSTNLTYNRWVAMRGLTDNNNGQGIGATGIFTYDGTDFDRWKGIVRETPAMTANTYVTDFYSSTTIGMTAVPSGSTGTVTSTTTLIQSIYCNNMTGAAVNLTVMSGSSGTEYFVGPNFSLPAQSSLLISTPEGMVMSGGIRQSAGTANAVACNYNGKQ